MMFFITHSDNDWQFVYIPDQVTQFSESLLGTGFKRLQMKLHSRSSHPCNVYEKRISLKKNAKKNARKCNNNNNI